MYPPSKHWRDIWQPELLTTPDKPRRRERGENGGGNTSRPTDKDNQRWDPDEVEQSSEEQTKESLVLKLVYLTFPLAAPSWVRASLRTTPPFSTEWYSLDHKPSCGLCSHHWLCRPESNELRYVADHHTSTTQGKLIQRRKTRYSQQPKVNC